MDSTNDDEAWETVVSKNALKKEQRAVKQKKAVEHQKKRDIQYLLTHSGFQKHRITAEKAIRIIREYTNDNPEKDLGTIFVASAGRCVGHLISVSDFTRTCLQCNWSDNGDVLLHCCCGNEVITALPPNFYLGCDGFLSDYLYVMKEKPIIY